MSFEEVEAIPLDSPRDGLPEITNEDIDDAVAQLASGHGAFAVDTERAMGIRYSARAYLVQVRREGAGTFLIDPIGIEDRLEGLRDVMDDEWILHAASQDLPCLHELGLYPSKVFDTEIAGLILGFERVSLQAMVAEVLGHALAKEYTTADWSQRPLGPELRTYAALDVELLEELKVALTRMLESAGRFEWFEQECEEVRLHKPSPPPQQPWRRPARQAQITDQRSLAMVRELWNVRDDIAKRLDMAPGKILPNKALAELASRKPRSRADVVNSSLLRGRERSKHANSWWAAIERVWRMEQRELPERRFREHSEPYPAITKKWETVNPEAAERWALVRGAVTTHADDLGIRQDVLLKPALQKQLAWEGWEDRADVEAKLAAWGARPWQISEVIGPISARF